MQGVQAAKQLLPHIPQDYPLIRLLCNIAAIVGWGLLLYIMLYAGYYQVPSWIPSTEHWAVFFLFFFIPNDIPVLIPAYFALHAYKLNMLFEMWDEGSEKNNPLGMSWKSEGLRTIFTSLGVWTLKSVYSFSSSLHSLNEQCSSGAPYHNQSVCIDKKGIPIWRQDALQCHYPCIKPIFSTVRAIASTFASNMEVEMDSSLEGICPVAPDGKTCIWNSRVASYYAPWCLTIMGFQALTFLCDTPWAMGPILLTILQGKGPKGILSLVGLFFAWRRIFMLVAIVWALLGTKLFFYIALPGMIWDRAHFYDHLHSSELGTIFWQGSWLKPYALGGDLAACVMVVLLGGTRFTPLNFWAWTGLSLLMGPVMLKYMVMGCCLDGIYTQLNLLLCPWYLLAKGVENSADFFLRLGLRDKSDAGKLYASKELVFGIFVVTHGCTDYTISMMASSLIVKCWTRIQELVRGKNFSSEGPNPQPLKGNELLDAWCKEVSADKDDAGGCNEAAKILLMKLKEIDTKGDDESIWWRYMPQVVMGEANLPILSSPSKVILEGQGEDVNIGASWTCDPPVVIYWNKLRKSNYNGQYEDHLCHYPRALKSAAYDDYLFGTFLSPIKRRQGEIAPLKRRVEENQERVGAAQNWVVGWISNLCRKVGDGAAAVVNAIRPAPGNGGPTAAQLIVDIDSLMARLNGLRGNQGGLNVVDVDNTLTRFGEFRRTLQDRISVLPLRHDIIDQQIQHVNRSLDILEGAGGFQIQMAAPQPQRNAPQPAGAAPQPQRNAPQPAGAAPQPQRNAPQPAGAAPQPQRNAPQPQVAAPPTAHVNGSNSMSAAQAAMAQRRASGRNALTMQGGVVAPSTAGGAGSKRDASGNPKP